ncbi:SfnB family sulfur acquisition oxidoreductase [Burkholderia sp. WAC0059]|uniref:SfnB family sulfur acquisition oxidoreductase n=1 Tax=Burkholderia sp. WAC0059 TaxID=2066022 RepID=UPI000C7E91D6|nr:SfnB family sulfur acquisition oxidoreductase [Burkholderia sp. WAC0059]PLZ01804.1 SfnB family sulfur acquisition oxidoreductase [Burkholderia sp. WAC0059]
MSPLDATRPDTVRREREAIPAHRIRSDAEALSIAAELVPRLAAGASDRDAARRLPYDEMAELGRSGLLGITIPREYGGADVGAGTLAEVAARLSEADSSIGQIPQNHFYSIEAFRLIGTPSQKSFFFGEILAGRRFGAAIAERGTRTSAAADRKTRLSRNGQTLQLDGEKAYCTGALMSDWISVFARDDDGRQHMAYVRRDSPGLTLRDDWSGMGQRTTASGTAVFDAVPVQPGHILPFQNVFDQPTRLGPYSQLYHTAIQLGIARAALRDLRRFVRERQPSGTDGTAPRADETLLLHDAGALQVDLHAAEALLAIAADSVEAIRETASPDALARASIAVAQAKVLTTELALKAGGKLLELTGAEAALAKHNLDRHWRNARTHTLHDPVRWKFATLGNYCLNGVLPPRRGYI